MKADITRDIIQDLLPIYLAGEASKDTAALVEQYLKTDPELAKLAEHPNTTGLTEIPVVLSKEAAMEAYLKATQQMIYRTLALSAVVVILVLGIVGAFLYLVVGLR